ncbi:MAG: VWA domain-containing protein [Bacteroidales bacterium]|nr:VWA domain-containing protein [Bacteroidales bacterium]
MKKLAFGIAVLLAVAGCDSEGFMGYDIAPSYDKGESDGYAEGEEPGGSQGAIQGKPGVITAGEWNDLDNWDLWSRLMNSTSDEQGEEQTDEQRTCYGDTAPYWRFWTNRRVALKVVSGDNAPLPGVKVVLSDGNTKIWEAVTDVLGRADCWVGLHNFEYQSGKLSISLNGVRMEGEPAVTGWSEEPVQMNTYTISADAPEPKADILFIVDATGSMSDELEFLKADLEDILKKGRELNTSITFRTGALFYRDKGDTYLTRVSGFTTDLNKTSNFIKKQFAAEGGDFPEAVHTALEESLQKFDWNASARARIAFILLDAPPHQDHQGVLESIHKSIDRYAAMGIKLIPIASSGIDKPTEFFLRMVAMVTEGTYVFITDDSGVGNEHLEPTVGEYKVELLNDLMVRLLHKYLE